MIKNETSSIDISIFKAPTQTSNDDRVALETIRAFVSDKGFQYNYLELGSYLGGTLLPHLVSPDCSRILSVDKRVSFQPDERRTEGYFYAGITTDDLINELSRHVDDSECLHKLETHDGVVGDLDPQLVLESYPSGFHLCFIDAEHTNEAVFSDFLHTYKLAASNSIIMLHDSWLLGAGIQNIMCYLNSNNTPFYFCKIKDSVSAFFLGNYANQDQLPQEIRSVPFNKDDYFREINGALWNNRKLHIINSLSIKTLLKVIVKRIIAKLRV